MSNENHITPLDLKEAILSRIDTERIAPRARMWWLVREYGVWFLWGLSVLVGAVALAVILYTSMHIRYALYEATHESFTTFLFEAAPYLWFIAFAVMAIFAFYNLRHTKTGYRYSLTQVIGSSLLLSLIGGVALHAANFGQFIDNELGLTMPLYESHEVKEMHMWHSPVDGRLVGKVATDTAPVGGVVFTDMDGVEWRVNVTELRQSDQAMLFSGKTVRLLGTGMGEGSHDLFACGVFPWMYEKNTGLKALSDDRQNFVDLVQTQKEQLRRRRDIERMEEVVEAETKHCSELPFLKRFNLIREGE